MTIEGFVVQKEPYIYYDGTNSALIIARYQSALLASATVDPDGTIHLVEIYGAVLDIPPHTYIVGPGAISDDRPNPAAVFEWFWHVLEDPTPPATPQVLASAVAAGALPALTLLSPNYTMANIPFDKPLPLTTVVGDLHWRAIAGAALLATIQLQAIANPIVLNASGSPSMYTSVTLFLRTVGLASVAGVVLVEVQNLD